MSVELYRQVRLLPDLDPSLSSELKAALDLIPAATCRRRTECCALLPPMSLIEAGLLVRRLAAEPPDSLRRLVGRIVRYFFLNPVSLMGCPFLEDRNCLVYPDRPFGCRAYGLWSPRAYRRLVEAGRKSQKEVQKAWASLGVTLPRAVVNHRPVYCRFVTTVNGAEMDDRLLDEVQGRVRELDGRLGRPAAEFSHKYRHDLSFLLTASFLGYDQSLRYKVAVVREHLDHGRSSVLDYLINSALEKTEDLSSLE